MNAVLNADLLFNAVDVTVNVLSGIDLILAEFLRSK